MSTKELIDEVASLPIEKRVLILDSILRSMNPPDEKIDRKWAKVAKQRLAEIQSGQVKLVPGGQVFDGIWSRFSK